MNLPPLAYDCVSCGKSCTDFKVEVALEDVDRVRNSDTTKALEKAGFQPIQVIGQQVFLEKIDGSRCRYLDENTLCLLHQEGGFAHKPKTCQDFPFIPVSTPGGVYLGLSFYCTAVAQSMGRPLAGRETEFQSLAGPKAMDADSQWSLWGEIAVDWQSYLRIEEFCRTAMINWGLDGLASAAWRLGQTVCTGDASYLSDPSKGGLETNDLQPIALRLVPFMETTDENAAQAMATLIEAGAPFDSAALGRRTKIHTPPKPDHDPDWFIDETRRYLDHVLFRKSLLSAPNVLSRVCLIPLAGQLLRVYAYTRAALQQRPLERDDYFKAVGIVEGRLMAHTSGLEPSILGCAQKLVALPSSKLNGVQEREPIRAQDH